MLNKIKLTVAVLFLGASLASAETYNEFRAKNGMDSKGKTVKSSTSAQFQKATPKNDHLMAKFDSSIQVPELELESNIRADELKLSNIHVALYVEGFYELFEKQVSKFDSFLHVGTRGGEYSRQDVEVYNINTLKDAILKHESVLVLELRKQCLYFAKREVRDGKKIRWINLYLSHYKLTPTPINETRILVNETYQDAVCGFYEY